MHQINTGIVNIFVRSGILFPTVQCILLLICSKSHLDDDPTGPKHVDVWIFH